VPFPLATVAAPSAAPAARTRDRDGAPPSATPAEPADGAAPRDRVTLSREAQDRAGGEKPEKTAGEGQERTAGKPADRPAENPTEKPADRPIGRSQDKATGKLTADQQRLVLDLTQRDAHVHQHEAAHQAAGGSLAGGADFSYQVGPDGKSYAVGGEVSIHLAAGRTPDETIANARRVRAAALAPSDPSAQDLSVAAAATSMEMAAVVRKAREASRAYAKNAGAAKKDPGAAEAQGTTQPAAAPVARAA
jgi:hypothetical protein